jgi:hypothetical protein
MVKVKATPPTVTEVGLRLVIVGTGFVTVKSRGVDVPPPGAGFETVICRIPAVWMSIAAI